jgi:hypothetical protein
VGCPMGQAGAVADQRDTWQRKRPLPSSPDIFINVAREASNLPSAWDQIQVPTMPQHLHQHGTIAAWTGPDRQAALSASLENGALYQQAPLIPPPPAGSPECGSMSGAIFPGACNGWGPAPWEQPCPPLGMTMAGLGYMLDHSHYGEAMLHTAGMPHARWACGYDCLQPGTADAAAMGVPHGESGGIPHWLCPPGDVAANGAVGPYTVLPEKEGRKLPS